MKVTRYHSKPTKFGLNSLWVRTGVDPTTLPKEILEKFGAFHGHTDFDLDSPRTKRNALTPTIRAGIEREGFLLQLGPTEQAS